MTARRSTRPFARHGARRRVRMRAVALGFAAMLLAVPSGAAAQSAGTSNLLSTPAGWPSSGALSGFTATALDPLAIYMNPAGLAVQDERTLLLHHALLPFTTTWDLAAVSYPVPGLGGVGLGFARIGTGEIEAYDAGNRPLGTIGYSETVAAASISRRVRGPLWGGVTFKILAQSLGGVSASAPAFDAGLLYRPALLRGGQVGFSIQNAVAGSLDLGGVAPALDRSIRLGFASPEWRVSPLSAGRVVLDLATRGKEGMKPRFGVEFNRAGLGAVRAGLSNGNPLVGLGLRFRRYEFDYAYQSGAVEATQQFAVQLAWGEPLSSYDARRTADLRRAAEDSIRATRSRQIADDRARAERSESQGDWETALILWEVLEREQPEETKHAGRAALARREIHARAEEAVSLESVRRLTVSLAELARAAITRGDMEEAAGLVRGIRRDGSDSAAADTIAALKRQVETARQQAADRALASADSLLAAGRALAAAREAALAIRLRPDDPRAMALWSDLERSLGKATAEAHVLSRKLDALSALNTVSGAYAEGRYTDAQAAVQKALALDPSSAEARDWRDRIARRLSTPTPDLDARIKQLYIKGMEAFTVGDYKEALRSWEQILVLDPLNESARRNVLEARDRMKAEARR